MSAILGLGLPKEYGYVITTTAASFFVAFWHGFRIGGFRRAAGVPYPKAFADTADIAAADSAEKKKQLYLFNCAQRAHANYLENHASVALAILVSGVGYPLVSAGLGAGWMLCRIAYAVGYTRADRNDGKGRLVGSGAWLLQLGLFGLTAWSGIKMVL